MKRKILSCILSAVMVGSLLVGCGSADGTTDTTSTPSTDSAVSSTDTESPSTNTDGKIKIGVSIWSSTDVLGSQCKMILDEAAEALDVEVQYVDQGHV